MLPRAYIAITTKFIGPSNHRVARVKASASTYSAGSQSVTLPWDHKLSPEGNHVEAAERLAEKLGWNGEWTMGDLGDHYVFIRRNPADEPFAFKTENLDCPL